MNNNSESIKYWMIKLIKKNKKWFNWKKMEDGIFLKKIYGIVIKPDSASQHWNLSTWLLI
jgi:hypothetical protein